MLYAVSWGYKVSLVFIYFYAFYWQQDSDWNLYQSLIFFNSYLKIFQQVDMVMWDSFL